MESDIRSWREEAALTANEAPRRRYPAELRQRGAELIRVLVASGRSMEAACSALGIPSITGRRWLLRHGTFAEVKVLPAPKRTVRLVLSHGHVDLTLAELSDLLRAT